MSVSKFGDTDRESRSEFTANMQMAGIDPAEKKVSGQTVQKIDGFLKKMGVPPGDAKKSAEFIAEIATIAKPEDMPNIVKRELTGLIKNPALAAEIPKMAESLSRVATGTAGLSMSTAAPTEQTQRQSYKPPTQKF